jgi:hypothetical protein
MDSRAIVQLSFLRMRERHRDDLCGIDYEKDGGGRVSMEWQRKRLESVRVRVNEMLLSIDGMAKRQEATVQLHGVSTFASMLAAKRGHNPQLAAIAGLFHGYYGYKTGIPEFPGPNSAEAARPILRDMGMLSEEEQITVLRSIFYQDDNRRTHGPYEEIIKDAHVLQLYFHHGSSRDADRLRHVLAELGMGCDPHDAIPAEPAEPTPPAHKDIRSRLADIAEREAMTGIVGVPGDDRYREICRYWPDPDIYKVLKNSWCAAFVYHCCRLAGFRLPIRYPNGKYRFAGVGAWLDWGQLPETGYYYAEGQEGYMPERGDIVIYDKLLSDHAHDHIGIVLASDENVITVAEGNRDNENYSSVFQRDRSHRILGYIRIDNRYEYRFDGDYQPLS